MKPLAIAPAFAFLAACATMPDAPIVEGGPPAAAGTRVTLGQPVWAGAVAVTPLAVIEDSRCPENARCVTAGRIVVTTRIDGAGWRETVPLELGEPHVERGRTVTLVSAIPEPRAGVETAPGDYRFVFERGR